MRRKLTADARLFKARLLKLARFVKKQVPRDRFNFKRYFAMSPTVDALPLTTQPSMSLCNSVGCALGWGTAVPEFKKLGLHLFKDNGFVGVGYGLDHGSYAACALFGLTEDEFNFLFIPREDLQDEPEHVRHWDTYGCFSPLRSASAQEVAENIEWFVGFKYGTGLRKDEPWDDLDG